MLRVPPLVVTATSSVPGAAARCADSMMAPVTVGELFGLITMIFTVRSPGSDLPAAIFARPGRERRRQRIGRRTSRRPNAYSGGLAALRGRSPTDGTGKEEAADSEFAHVGKLEGGRSNPRGWTARHAEPAAALTSIIW